MRSHRIADCCYLAALAVLPLVGLGVVRTLSGVDLGTGLQPAYLLLAVAWFVRAGVLLEPDRDESRRLRRRWPVPIWVAWGVAAAAALALSGLGLVLRPAPLLSGEAWPRYGKQLVQVVVMTGFLAYPALWTVGWRRWRTTSAWLTWSTWLLVAYALVQGVHELRTLPGLTWLEQLLTSNPGILSGSERLYLEGFTTIPRLRGTMCEPLYLGSYLVGVLPFLASQGRRRLALVAAVVLLLTWSRGAWLAALVAGAVWWVLRRRAGLAGPDRRVLAWLAGALLAGMVLVVLVAGPDALLWPGRRLAQTLDRTDWSNLTRLYSLQAAWRTFLHSPVVGVGWGQFPYHFYALVDLPGLQSQFTWPVVNNVPLLVLCETGLVGFLVLAGAAGTLLVATWRALARRADPARKARLAALAAGGCGLAAQLQFFSQYNLPHLWVVPGLWLAALAALPPSKMARRSL